MSNFYSKNIEQSLIEMGSTKNGLSQEEAVARIKLNPPTESKKTGGGIVSKFFAQFFDFMIIILLIASAISITIGIIDRKAGDIADGCIILFIVIMNAIFGVVQEHKAEKSLEALNKLTQQEAHVIRGGVTTKVPANSLVKGDIVVLEAGVIVPADLRLIDGVLLKIDESALTGESQAVDKNPKGIYKENCALGELKNMAFKGTTVMSGRGLGMVVAVGEETEFGKIASVIKDSKKELTPLEKSIKSVSKILTWLVLAVALVTFIIEVFVSHLSVLDAFLTAVAISVAAIPESMPAVITIIMSMGVSKLARQKAIIKRLHSVETLGACDVICSDKTGTLTQNRMTSKKCFISGKIYNCEKKNDDLFPLAYGVGICNDSKFVDGKLQGEGTENALLEFSVIQGVQLNGKRVDEKPFDSDRKLMSVLIDDGTTKTMFTKGGVDRLIDKCDKIYDSGRVRPLTPRDKECILEANEKLCVQAMRVIALAVKENVDRNEFKEDKLVFVGLVGMIDPPRKEAKEALKKCRKAGMRPIMITGDYPQTALAIAKEIGLAKSEKEVLSGGELAKLSDEELNQKIAHISVFARVSPSDKMRIVEALKRQGHVVGMTGDGVNDAPSLKKANIGIGMGKSGTDVAKEVADLIITDDNFATIIVAVEEGRKIYKNIQKTVKFLFSANFAELMSLFVTTLLFPNCVFLLPVQILFVNLITDSLPAVALGVEKTEKEIMLEKPRSPKEGLFSHGVGYSIVILGMFQTLFVVLAYAFGAIYYCQGVAMTMGFYTLNILQMFYLASIRTEKPFYKSKPWQNKFFLLAVSFCFALIGVFAFTPLRSVLNLEKLNLSQWLVIFALSVAMLLVAEIYKFIERKIEKKKTNNS